MSHRDGKGLSATQIHRKRLRSVIHRLVCHQPEGADTTHSPQVIWGCIYTYSLNHSPSQEHRSGAQTDDGNGGFARNRPRFDREKGTKSRGDAESAQRSKDVKLTDEGRK